MILSQIFSCPPFPPCLLLFLSTQLRGCSTEESQLLLGLAPTVEVRAPSLIPTQPNSDRISPEAPGSRAPRVGKGPIAHSQVKFP